MFVNNQFTINKGATVNGTCCIANCFHAGGWRQSVATSGNDGVEHGLDVDVVDRRVEDDADGARIERRDVVAEWGRARNRPQKSVAAAASQEAAIQTRA